MKNPIPFLRNVGHFEAISFLALLGIAMPLKYLAGMPMAVKVLGWVHGALFVVFGIALLRTMLIARWPIMRSAIVFISAFVPFGPFLLDRRMAEYAEEFARHIGRSDRREAEPQEVASVR